MQAMAKAALKATLREAGSGTRSIRSKFPGLPSLWFKTHHRLVEEDLSELPEVCAMLQHTSSTWGALESTLSLFFGCATVFTATLLAKKRTFS